MLINYHVTGSDRKRLVAAIAEHTGRMYRAYEGDIRVITRDKSGKETRYTVKWNPQDDSVTIERM